MDAYVYHEGQGTKGGDNVASMVILFLKQQGWLQDVIEGEEIAGRELTVIMDNCPGQNKNNTVIRIANLLVQVRYFHKVNMLFYIAGHTKNACERWFNTLKSMYRLSDIWTMDQLFKILKTHERLIVHRINEGDFKEYTAWLKFFYCNIKSGYSLKSHMFSVGAMFRSDSGKTMYILKT